jgi:membrane-associated phospholipid phosphatase
MRSAGVLLSLCALAPGTLRAAPSDETPRASPSHELSRTSPAWLAGEALVATSLLVTSLAVTRDAPSACRWCRSNAFDDGARDALVAARPREAGMLSDLAVAGALPAFALAASMAPAYRAERRGHALENVVIVATATGLSISLALGSKAVVARERPAAHHGAFDRSPAVGRPEERYVSFFSSHTAAAFAAASSVVTVSYLRGYESAPYVAAIGGALSVGVGLLRIAADMHWATDTLVGAGAGTLAGVSVPLLLHGRKERSVTLVPALGRRFSGLEISGSF